jgi:C_GCAxxG_C_C family probable redox protein
MCDGGRRVTREIHPERAHSLADEVESTAAGYYETGYWCGESVLKAVNDALGNPMPAETFRLASGFCEGLGGSRCVCGALAGGVMATGLFVGRISPHEPWEPSYEAAAKLRERWMADQQAATCEEVAVRFGGMERPERWAHCTLLVGRTARWVIEMAEEAGVVVAADRDDAAALFA